MDDSDSNIEVIENFREIEDIIDERKRLGQYNVYKSPMFGNIRCVYSSPTGTSTDNNRSVRFDEASMVSNTEGPSSIKHTDSEITVVRVKCNDELFKRKLNKWDTINDIAVPGDGTHLGESPSLVNLATLVAQNIQCEGDEYLVPLSSWDPYLKNDDVHINNKCCSDSKVNKIFYQKHAVRSTSTNPRINTIETENNHNSRTNIGGKQETSNLNLNSIFRRPSWAGKISKFIRKHYRKLKTLSNQNNQSSSDSIVNGRD